jgi:hypothetical protein
MRIGPVIVATLALLVPEMSAAQPGVNITWGEGCYPENPSGLKTFACNTNVGAADAVASFRLAGDQPLFIGIAVTCDLFADSGTLPDWWQFYNQGSCRRAALTASADFISAPQLQCVDPWQGQALGGIGAYQTIATVPPLPSGYPNAARLKVFLTVPYPIPLTAGVEYYGVRLRIAYARTVGDSSCAGCDVPMAIGLNSIQAAESNGYSEFLSDAITQRCMFWQRTYRPCWVPTRNVTWGQVKSLYR